MHNDILKVGITGGIGAGKSIVSKIFKILGIHVYDADARAKYLMTHDPTVVEEIKLSFGDDAYLPDGNLNRKYIAKYIFEGGVKYEIINKIVHPAVAIDFEKWSTSHENAAYVLKEAALLFESDSYKKLDYIITVLAPVELRTERVLIRDRHRTKNDVKKIISIQMKDEEKISKSQFIITNDNSQLLLPQVIKIHDFLRNS